MFIRASTVVVSAIALAGVATAAPTALEARGNSGNTCNSGSMQCCSSVQDASSTVISSLFGPLGIPKPPAGTQVGLTCSPMTIGGTGSGATCSQQTVCCNGNNFSGFIVIGCSPIVINIIL